MIEELLHHRGNTLVRRLVLAPGESTRWHTDPFDRVSVVLNGEALSIEFRDGGSDVRVAVAPGQVDWDEPSGRVHRAVNIGGIPYEEVTTFLLRHPTDAPQPDADLLT
jgi:oxalate decarboxylase/phosphoglucose isomerase-like protein (cupin superfamily)